MPPSFLDRRAATRPTRKTTESRRLLQGSRVSQCPNSTRSPLEGGGYGRQIGNGTLSSETMYRMRSAEVLPRGQIRRTPAVPYWNVRSLGLGCLAEAARMAPLKSDMMICLEHDEVHRMMEIRRGTSKGRLQGHNSYGGLYKGGGSLGLPHPRWARFSSSRLLVVVSHKVPLPLFPSLAPSQYLRIVRDHHQHRACM